MMISDDGILEDAFLAVQHDPEPDASQDVIQVDRPLSGAVLLDRGPRRVEHPPAESA
jgi:hypothetical protein